MNHHNQQYLHMAQSHPLKPPSLDPQNHQSSLPAFNDFAPPPAPPQPSPSSSQRPVHTQLADPFPRHDPFRSTSQNARSGNTRIRNGEGGHGDGATQSGGWTTSGSSAPGFSSSSHVLGISSHSHRQSSVAGGDAPSRAPHAIQTSLGQSPYLYNGGRRKSLGASPMQTQGGLQESSAVHSTNSISRPMGPPTSSPRQQDLNRPLSHTIAQSASPRSREPPAMSSNHRPGTSMSISALIAEPSGHPKPPSNIAPTSAGVHTASTKSMHPPSPRRGLSLGSRVDFGPYGRPETPERYFPGFPRPSDPHNYASNSPRHSFVPGSGSPSNPSLPPHNSQLQYAQGAVSAPHSHHSSPNDTEPARNRLGHIGVPARPSSQPSGQFRPNSELEYKDRFGFSELQNHRPHHLSGAYGSSMAELTSQRSPQIFHRDRLTHNNVTLDRPISVQPTSHSTYTPPRERQNWTPRQPLADGHSHDPYWKGSPKDGPPPATQAFRDDTTSVYRPGFRNAGSSSHTGQLKGSSSEDRARLAQPEPSKESAREPGRSSLPGSESGSPEKRRFDVASAPLASGSSSFNSQGTATADAQARKHGEELAVARFLGVSPDHNRRTGRASPLPQAVQGAQARHTGPGGNPGIKSEFGRMFSGLGSGLVSAPGGTGASTPSRQSPLPRRRSGDAMERVLSGSGSDPSLTIVGSMGSKKTRKMKEDEGRIDGVNGDGRDTPSQSHAKASKRPKHAHTTHHCHHHTQPHHHHHHHHWPEEDVSVLAQQHGNDQTQNPGGVLKFTAAVSRPLSTTPTHHHHHHHPHPPHHHHHHHHHHKPLVAIGPMIQQMEKPVRIINSQKVLDSVADLPRHHLGSMVYQAEVKPPLRRTTSPVASHHFRSIPKPMPRMDGNMNCTFTVRVPRYYLLKEQRMQICRQRYLWGSDVYTDDSDPIAAAIHSGWLRGAWDEDLVDVEMLDLGPEPFVPVEAPDSLLEPPESGPMSPRENMELHITILLLPALEKYASTVAFGIKSRGWANTHDGISYKIHKLKWVDEGMSRGQERTAAARRERLDAAWAASRGFP